MILGLDTATPSTSVALWAPGGPAVERRDDPAPGDRPGHAARLLVLVEDVLRDHGWDAVDRIAVGVGPGGFTGLRLGIATARALAQARDLPLVGVSSLEALVRGSDPRVAARHGGVRGSDPRVATRHESVVAVIDARRGEVFALGPGFGPAAFAPEDLAARVRGGALAVGDGAIRFREQLEGAGAVVPADDSPLHRVSALEVARLGAEREPADRDALLPDYRREPDAKPRQP